jgi:hypothetical protein
MKRYESSSQDHLTSLQEVALSSLCERFHVPYSPDHYPPTFELPEGYVAGFLGGPAIQDEHPTIYVGCSPEGMISS